MNKIKSIFSWLEEKTFFESWILIYIMFILIFELENGSMKYFSYWIVASILAGVWSIKVYIEERFDKLEAKLEEQNKKEKGNK